MFKCYEIIYYTKLTNIVVADFTTFLIRNSQ